MNASRSKNQNSRGIVGSNQLSQLLTAIFFFLKSPHFVFTNVAGTNVLPLAVKNSISRFDREDAIFILKMTENIC